MLPYWLPSRTTAHTERFRNRMPVVMAGSPPQQALRIRSTQGHARDLRRIGSLAAVSGLLSNNEWTIRCSHEPHSTSGIVREGTQIIVDTRQWTTLRYSCAARRVTGRATTDVA